MKRDLSYTAFEPQVDYPYFSAMDRIDFSRSAEAAAAGTYCPGMAWLLGEMSMLAYLRDADAVRAALARVHSAVEVQPVFGDGVNAFLARTPADAFLIFRGTEKGDPGTLVADLKFRLIPDEEGWAHMGFKEAWASVATQVVERYQGRRLWISGHSLGAALALFAGADLPACAVYTYGAPRVGDGTFRDAIRVPVWRVVNNNDIVPMLPPPLLYRHVGEARYIDHRGEVTTEDSVWRRAQSQFQGHREHAGEFLRQWSKGQFSALPSANLSDHAPINYVKALKTAWVEDSAEGGGGGGDAED